MVRLTVHHKHYIGFTYGIFQFLDRMGERAFGRDPTEEFSVPREFGIRRGLANPLIVGTFGLLAKPSLCLKTCGPFAERQLPGSLHPVEELTSMAAQAMNWVLGLLAERQLPGSLRPMTSMVAQAMNSVTGELIAIEIVIFLCGITIGWAISTGRGG